MHRSVNIEDYLLFKVAVRAEILPRDFFQTPGNYYLSPAIAKIERLKKISRLKKFGQFLRALTVNFSIFKNKKTSHLEILIKVYR